VVTPRERGELTFLDAQIHTADPAARTAVEGFGPIEFDVSAIVNDWITGANDVLAIALTGLNDASGNEFLHGFLNDSENPGSSFLTPSTRG
jgi:hypothetical protein